MNSNELEHMIKAELIKKDGVPVSLNYLMEKFDINPIQARNTLAMIRYDVSLTFFRDPRDDKKNDAIKYEGELRQNYSTEMVKLDFTKVLDKDFSFAESLERLMEDLLKNVSPNPTQEEFSLHCQTYYSLHTASQTIKNLVRAIKVVGQYAVEEQKISRKAVFKASRCR